MIPWILAVTLLAASAPPLAGELEPATVARIDEIVEQALADGPIAGLSLAVAHGDEVVLARGYGFADLENEVPATERTVYRIGSVTKQFTAAAILQQVEIGALELDDEITEFLPEFPTQGHTVTVRHLLTHTSGIKSYTSLPGFWDNVRLDHTHEELLARFQGEPFDFAPGERFLYNNSAYYMLGVILERVSGSSYENYLREELCEPLGLEQTVYGWTRPLIPHRARGYEVEEGALLNAQFMSMGPPGAAGGLCSTVLDLVRWMRGLVNGEVIGEDSFDRMTTRARLESGAEVDYGFGLVVIETDGRRKIEHGGGIFGFTAQTAWYPGDDLTVVVLTNTSRADAGGVERQVAAVVRRRLAR